MPRLSNSVIVAVMPSFIYLLLQGRNITKVECTLDRTEDRLDDLTATWQGYEFAITFRIFFNTNNISLNLQVRKHGR